MSVCPATREPCGRLDCDPPQDCAELYRVHTEPPAWFSAVYDDYLRSPEGQRLYGRRVVSKCPLWMKLCAAAAVLYVLVNCWGPIFTKVLR